MRFQNKYALIFFFIINTILSSNLYALRNLAKVEDRSISENSFFDNQVIANNDVPNNTNDGSGEAGLITYPVETQPAAQSTSNKVLTTSNEDLNDDFNNDKENHQAVLNELKSMTDSQRLQRLENIVENQKNAKYERKIKQLQAELQNLRGLFEEKQHVIDRVIAQQKNLIEDLGRKISANNPHNAAVNNSGSAQIDPTQLSTEATNINTNISDKLNNQIQSVATKPKGFSYKDNGLDQQALYSAAYESIKSRNYPKAIELFNKYTTKYPNGQFSASASYWVGEIYMIQSNYSKAASSFDNVLTKYPEDPKASDAMYKKALIYLYSKDFNKAKNLLAEVSKKYKNTAASKLAEKQLKDIENISRK